MMKQVHAFARLALIFVFIVPSLNAQVSGGVIRGETRDSSGAAVANAKITITSVASGFEMVTQSSSEGIYVSPTLTPGDYKIAAEGSGFKKEVFGPVTVQVNQTVTANFSLVPGANSEVVTVLATSAQLVETENATVSQVIGSEAVSQIPLVSRSWQDLIGLSAGVNPGPPGISGSPNAYNINGQRDKYNGYLVDGVGVSPPIQGHLNDFSIPLDAVQEFSVQENAFSAEYGDVAGGVINLQSKSGTNKFHGSAFEFFRNDALDATDVFQQGFQKANPSLPNNKLRYNQFGGSIGGPIRLNKTFFFGDYQGTRQITSAGFGTHLPTDAERNGIFPTGIFDISQPFYFLGAPIPAGTPIPIDPSAAALVALLPHVSPSNAAIPVGISNYFGSAASSSTINSFDVRIDHQFSDRNTLFGRYSFQNSPSFNATPFGAPLAGSVLGFTNVTDRTQNVAIGDNFLIRPNLINELRFGYIRNNSNDTSQNFGKGDIANTMFGIPGVPDGTLGGSGLPFMQINGYTSIGDGILTPLLGKTNTATVSDNLTWIKGRHTLKAGFNYGYEWGTNYFTLYAHSFDIFTGIGFPVPAGSNGTGMSGDGFADFLQGRPIIILRDKTLAPSNPRAPMYGMFVQDDFKVSSRLTLNLGLRYDIMPFFSDANNHEASFDPTTQTMLVAGVNGQGSRPVKTDYKNFGPRVGLAYQLTSDGKTVLRSGYGLAFTDPIGAANALISPAYNPPFAASNTIVNLGPLLNLPDFLSSTNPATAVLQPVTIPPANAPSGDLLYFPPNGKNPYSQTWNLSIQRALAADTLFEVAYTGTTGNRLFVFSNINSSPPTTGTPQKPFPTLGNIRTYSNAGHSSYHALQTKLEKRFSQGLYFLAAYTYSKSIDNQSNGNDNAGAVPQEPQDPFNLAAERGASSFDRTHRFAFSGVWQVPVGRGRTFQSNMPRGLDALIGGWQVSGIFTAETGAPFTVVMSCADIGSTNTFGSASFCRPDVSGNPYASHPHFVIDPVLCPTGCVPYLNPSAFTKPVGAFGDEPRNSLRLPSDKNLTLGVAKYFPLGANESRRLQFRAELFNPFSWTEWTGPIVNDLDNKAGTPVGQITGSSPARVVQFGLRLEF